MKKIKYVVLKTAVLFMRILYVPFKLLPTQEKVTFMSRQSNKPSIDFVLLGKAIKEKHPECKVVMITKKLENPVTYLLSILQQMYHIATSKTVILDSYNIPVSVLKHKKALCVLQIWHAIGSMKHFGYDMLDKEEGNSKEVAEIMCMHKNYTHILISSYSFIKDFLTGFRADASIIREIPLPKADCLTSASYKEEKRKVLFEKYPELKGKKNILYCPTFRKQTSDFDALKINELVNKVDYEKYNFIYCPHPISKVLVENSKIITVEESTFDMLFVCDYVISDYSSVIYEAGLVKMPVYLYAYDWDNYKEKRTFNIDLQKDVPTLFTADPDEILNAIYKEEFDWESYGRFIDDNVKMPEGATCCDEILKLIKF